MDFYGGFAVNDNVHPSLAPFLKAIPFESVGPKNQRASERERDNAAMELVGYVIVMMRFGLAIDWHEQLLKRANKVRRTQGNGEVVFVAETAEAIRAAVATDAKPAFVETEALLLLLSTTEQMP
jgi:hypothetical protein